MIESFNGRFREDCLNAHWFASLEDAQQKIDPFRWDYNEHHPHRSLKGQSPREFAEMMLTTAAESVAFCQNGRQRDEVRLECVPRQEARCPARDRHMWRHRALAALVSSAVVFREDVKTEHPPLPQHQRRGNRHRREALLH